MRGRTNPWMLVLLAAAGGIAMWAVEVLLTTSGNASFVPLWPFGAMLAAIAVALVAIAWPVRVYTRALRRFADAAAEHQSESRLAELRRDAVAKRVDPFQATRVLALARACSHAAALLGGGCVGVILWLVTRSVVPTSIWEAIADAAGAIGLLVAGLVVESWCMLPPDSGADGATDEPERAPRPVA